MSFPGHNFTSLSPTLSHAELIRASPIYTTMYPWSTQRMRKGGGGGKKTRGDIPGG